MEFYLEAQYVKQMKVDLLLHLPPLAGSGVQPRNSQDCKPQARNNCSSPVNKESGAQRDKVICPRLQVESGLEFELFKPGSLQS